MSHSGYCLLLRGLEFPPCQFQTSARVKRNYQHYKFCLECKQTVDTSATLRNSATLSIRMRNFLYKSSASLVCFFPISKYFSRRLMMPSLQQANKRIRSRKRSMKQALMTPLLRSWRQRTVIRETCAFVHHSLTVEVQSNSSSASTWFWSIGMVLSSLSPPMVLSAPPSFLHHDVTVNLG